jgi:hypothetical protein
MSDDNSNTSLAEALAHLREDFDVWEKKFQSQVERAWNKLTPEAKLLMFCAVVKRIHQGELIEKGSYRHVLYTTFGFSEDAYLPAQVFGYLDLHNAIYSKEELEEKVKKLTEEDK